MGDVSIAGRLLHGSAMASTSRGLERLAGDLASPGSMRILDGELVPSSKVGRRMARLQPFVDEHAGPDLAAEWQLLRDHMEDARALGLTRREVVVVREQLDALRSLTRRARHGNGSEVAPTRIAEREGITGLAQATDGARELLLARALLPAAQRSIADGTSYTPVVERLAFHLDKPAQTDASLGAAVAELRASAAETAGPGLRFRAVARVADAIAARGKPALSGTVARHVPAVGSRLVGATLADADVRRIAATIDALQARADTMPVRSIRDELRLAAVAVASGVLPPAMARTLASTPNDARATMDRARALFELATNMQSTHAVPTRIGRSAALELADLELRSMQPDVARRHGPDIDDLRTELSSVPDWYRGPGFQLPNGGNALQRMHRVLVDDVPGLRLDALPADEFRLGQHPGVPPLMTDALLHIVDEARAAAPQIDQELDDQVVRLADAFRPQRTMAVDDSGTSAASRAARQLPPDPSYGPQDLGSSLGLWGRGKVRDAGSAIREIAQGASEARAHRKPPTSWSTSTADAAPQIEAADPSAQASVAVGATRPEDDPLVRSIAELQGRYDRQVARNQRVAGRIYTGSLGAHGAARGLESVRRDADDLAVALQARGATHAADLVQDFSIGVDPLVDGARRFSVWRSEGRVIDHATAGARRVDLGVAVEYARAELEPAAQAPDAI